MTREEFENYLIDKLEEIKKVYNEYCPEDPYLSMCINGSIIMANNSHWEERCKHFVDCNNLDRLEE